MSDARLERLFRPRSVAVVGASPSPGKAGNALMRSLAGFPGVVHPVHPSAGEVLGRPAVPRIDALAEPPDLALIAVPAPAVPHVVRQCGDAGVVGAVVHAGGFAEADDAGRVLQEELAAAAAATGIRVLGPNTSGFIAPHARLCASFVASTATITRGPLAIVAQSGGVNHALAFAASGDGLGVHLAVGLGNAVDVTFADVLDAIVADGGPRVVALAIEGVADGRALVDAVARAVDRVPVVALKLGRHDVGDFARSHTGALTGSWTVARAALAQAGAVVVDDTTELLDAAAALARRRLAPRRRVGVGLVTGQAGPGLLFADALAGRGVAVPELPADTQRALDDVIDGPTFRRNPVDTGRPGSGFARVLELVESAPDVDLLAVYLLDEPEAIDVVAALRPVGPAVLGTAGPPATVATTRAMLAQHDVPVLPTPERAATAVAAIAADAQAAYRRSRAPAAPPRAHLAGNAGDRRAPAEGWDEDRAKRLVAGLGIAVPRRAVCASRDAALAAGTAIGFPVVAKLVHPALQHKTEAGAVRTGIRDAVDLTQALAELDGVRAPAGSRYLVEAMAAPGPELLLGAIRDPAFGPLVVLGAGGVEAEQRDEVAIRLAPVSELEAAMMLDELEVAWRYRGHRGRAAIDEAQLAAAIASLAALIAARADIAEIEINPLRVAPDGLPVALDALVVPAA